MNADELQHVVPLAGPRPDPDPGLGQLKLAIDRLNSCPREAERIDLLLEGIDAIDGAYHVGTSACSVGDLDAGERELRRAAEGGHPEAAVELAKLLASRVDDRQHAHPGAVDTRTDEMPQEAARWLQEAVDAGALAPEDFETLHDIERSSDDEDTHKNFPSHMRALDVRLPEPQQETLDGMDMRATGGLTASADTGDQSAAKQLAEQRARQHAPRELRTRAGSGDPSAATQTISPYVRRLRLAAELRALRAEHGLTHEQLAKQIGQSRAQILRLENGHVIDQDDVMRILDALGIDDERWTQIMTIAHEAGERGWWESNKTMGNRQALHANLEAGARTIREYQMTFIPGLLQTAEFTRARTEADRLVGRVSYNVDKAAAGRVGRQRMLCRPGGPDYEVVIDELAIRRAAAPWEVVKAQLYQIAATVNINPNITARVLPIDARIEGSIIPRSAFSIYTFNDPDDPTVAAVDTVTDDLVFIEADAVSQFEELYERIRDASLTVHDSIELLIYVAQSLPPSEVTSRRRHLELATWIEARRAPRTVANPPSAEISEPFGRAFGQADGLAG